MRPGPGERVPASPLPDGAAVVTSGAPLASRVPLASRAVAVTVVRWDDPEAARLRDLQQAELAVLYGHPDEADGADEPAEADLSRDQVDPSTVTATVLVRVDGEAAACGSVRDMSGLPDGRGGVHPSATGEVKRMYVAPSFRGRGLSRRVLAAVETAAVEAGLRDLVLECGTLQVEAIGLYLSMGYLPIERFGVYAQETGSRCFGKAVPERAGAASAGAAPAALPEPAVLDLRPVAWDHEHAAALRREMLAFNLERYPEVAGHVAVRGGFEGVDPRMGERVVLTLVAYRDGEPVGCGSLRPALVGSAFEVRTVFVRERARRAGVAWALLAALEDAALGLGADELLLETGIRQPEALRLYLALGFRPVLPFPPYGPEDDPFGLFLGKALGR
ncbi:GNAT family N-acetyltransferase [Antribacter gilvus]|uniref:GNAT family N-acetyltransferase n=1 Tax=Antribacter gilvus TaxID=2304675 RepID=UPI001F0BEE82|nr:GNAT family N-acetyltransferase [Antribacter gilvus]